MFALRENYTFCDSHINIVSTAEIALCNVQLFYYQYRNKICYVISDNIK